MFRPLVRATMDAFLTGRGALATLILSAAGAAWAQIPADHQDGSATNVARRYRGRRVYDVQLQWHQVGPAAQVPDPGKRSPAIEGPARASPVSLPQAGTPLSGPPPMVGPLRPPPQPQEEGTWITSTVDEILGVNVATNTPSGWGWLADQVRSNRVASAEAAREEEGLISEEDELLPMPGLLTDSTYRLGLRLERPDAAPQQEAPHGVEPKDTLFVHGLLSDRTSSPGTDRPSEAPALPTPGVRAPGGTYVPDGDTETERPMPRMDALLPARETDTRVGSAMPSALKDLADAARQLSTRVDPAAAVLAPSRTSPLPAIRSPGEGGTAGPSLSARYGERGALFSPGFSSTSLTATPAAGGLLMDRPSLGTPAPLFQTPSWTSPSMQPPATPSDLRPTTPTQPRTSLLGPTWLNP